MRKEPVKKRILKVFSVILPMVLTFDFIIFSPPFFLLSHIISGPFDNYGQTGEKIITKAPTVAEASTVASPSLTGRLRWTGWRAGMDMNYVEKYSKLS